MGHPAEPTWKVGHPAYKYTGQPFDDEGGFDLYYYGARYYDPEIGLFRAVDPLYGKYPGWGPYVYTLGNPLKYVDLAGDSALAANDQHSASTTTYLDMSRKGDLGPHAQGQLRAIDALPFDVVYRGGEVANTESGHSLGETTWSTGEKGQLAGMEVTLDIDDINKTGSNVPEIAAHENQHVLDVAEMRKTSSAKRLTPEERTKSEARARQAQKDFKKSLPGNRYWRVLRLYREQVKQNASRSQEQP